MIKDLDKLYPGFVDSVASLTILELEARIVDMQKGLEESEDHKQNNEALAQARATLSELSGPYNDVKKAVRLKTRYLIELLREKGK